MNLRGRSMRGKITRFCLIFQPGNLQGEHSTGCASRSNISSTCLSFLLVRQKLVRPAKKRFRGPIPAKFNAQTALDGDRLEWELRDSGRHVPMAPFTYDNEHLPGVWQTEHSLILDAKKGE